MHIEQLHRRSGSDDERYVARPPLCGDRRRVKGTLSFENGSSVGVELLRDGN